MKKYFPDGPQSWRETIESKHSHFFKPSLIRSPEEADAHIEKYLNNTKRKEYTIPAGTRRLLRKIPGLAPQCATSTKKLALHVLTTSNGKTQCRQLDGHTGGKYIVVGVAYDPKAKPEEGFLGCGCNEKEALLEFIWFKTWTVKSGNARITEAEGMKNDVFIARHRAFFAQAYSIGTLLDVDDLYSTDHPVGSPEYEARLRRLQVDRMIGVLNTLEGDPDKEYVLAKRVKEKAAPSEDVPMV
ncbi:hypothetical protein B0H19DRAFT_957428 [Mycena capillaripes]|nr:hypothetical protein B0H19DRAFT_957428 [Mycena capillaripes]